jgi:hypothetical protein
LSFICPLFGLICVLLLLLFRKTEHICDRITGADLRSLERMTVDRGRCRDRRVPECRGNCRRVYACLNQRGRIEMSKPYENTLKEWSRSFL